MKPEVINLRNKRIGQFITSIGAKVADAVELCQKAKELSASSEGILITAQRELEELYVSLDEPWDDDIKISRDKDEEEGK